MALKPISKFATKIVVLVVLVIGIVASVGWYVSGADKGTNVSFSEFEKTIQAEEGNPLSLKEKADGTLHLETEEWTIRHTSPSAKPTRRTISGKI